MVLWIKLLIAALLGYHLYKRSRPRSETSAKLLEPNTPSGSSLTSQHSSQDSTKPLKPDAPSGPSLRYERAGKITLILVMLAFFTALSIDSFPKLAWISQPLTDFMYAALVVAFVFAAMAGWTRGRVNKKVKTQ